MSNVEQIKQRLEKAVASLDQALAKKMKELQELRAENSAVDVKKFEQVITEKSKNIEELKQKTATFERENVKLKAELEEEKIKNQKLLSFNEDISTRVENVVKQLELVMVE